jgi:hypothetical protein
MARMKEILTVAGTLICAIGIGFVMQSSETAQERYGNSKSDGAEELEKTANSAMLDMQQITLTSGEFKVDGDQPMSPVIALPDTDAEVIRVNAPQSVLPNPAAPGAVVTPTCPIEAEARVMAAAMVNLKMTASCLPNERVTVHHNGMIFTETTSAAGTIDINVPALAQDAMFIMAFTNGEGAVAQTQVDELINFDRAVLQWKGNTGFEIHAREFGASYGDEGHHWKGAPGEIADAVTGRGGVLTRHGDPEAAEALMAEVYTFPKAETNHAGTVVLSVETEISAANCGIEIEAQSLQILGNGQIKTQDLMLPVPDCDAIGSFLVLNNLLQDLKVAAK